MPRAPPFAAPANQNDRRFLSTVTPSAQRPGRIKWFDVSKGFGSIVPGHDPPAAIASQAVPATPARGSNPRAAFLQTAKSSSAGKRLVQQFAAIAKPPLAKKRRGESGGGSGTPRISLPPKNRTELAATPQQNPPTQLRRAGQHQHGGGFANAARGVARPTGSRWPESMRRELHACKTPADRNAWAQKWGRYLSGQEQCEQRGPPRPKRPKTEPRRPDLG